jgi:hypothetical protein
MPINYVVQQGDCISSIAAEHGLLPDKIWNHPDNAELKRERENRNILFEGDVVVIPEIEIREETRPTDQRHKFLRKGVPEKLKIVLLDERDLPRKNLRYVLKVDGKFREGITKGDGSLEETIDPQAKRASLIVFDGEITEEHELKLGHLDPLTQPSGIQMRLSNLGFDCPVSGQMDEATAQAIMEFQEQRGLKVTGEMDDSTRNKLKEVYGS